jgi:hypothetical protein
MAAADPIQLKALVMHRMALTSFALSRFPNPGRSAS